MEYRTQKASGVAALKNGGYPVPKFTVLRARDASPEQLIGYFVRPCPLVPRHGFVDSRHVKSAQEAETVIRQTLKAEPDAELLLMPHLSSPFSGIWTEGLLTVGRGTDGATAGTSARTIPVLGDLFPPKVLNAAAITDQPYLELLFGDEKYNRYWMVQLRNGPKLPATVDFIPAKTKVTAVVEAEGDLLEWEKKVKAFKPGTVVWHPNGALASHYAVHAVLSNVPVLVSRQPKVGETLMPVGKASRPMNVKALRAGFMRAQVASLDYVTATHAMLAACHNVAVWKGERDVLLGFGMGCAYRLTLVAALGEMRHYRHERKERNRVYEQYWAKSLDGSARGRFQKALECFLMPGWSSAFGGRAWYRFARWAAVVYNCLQAKQGEQAVAALNNLVNCAHNTGWGFNKFVSGSVLDEAAKCPARSLLQCAGVMYEVLDPSTAQLAGAWARRWPIFIPADPRESAAERAKVVLKEFKVPRPWQAKAAKMVGAESAWCKEKNGNKPIPAVAGPLAAQLIAEANAIPVPKIVSAQYRVDLGKVHIQFKLAGGGAYSKCDLPLSVKDHQLAGHNKATRKSYAGSDTLYVPFKVFEADGKLVAGEFVVACATVMEKGGVL